MSEHNLIQMTRFCNDLHDDNKIIYSDAQKKELIIEILVHSILADKYNYTIRLQ